MQTNTNTKLNVTISFQIVGNWEGLKTVFKFIDKNGCSTISVSDMKVCWIWPVCMQIKSHFLYKTYLHFLKRTQRHWVIMYRNSMHYFTLFSRFFIFTVRNSLDRIYYLQEVLSTMKFPLSEEEKRELCQRFDLQRNGR
jgi:hypothetical protein